MIFEIFSEYWAFDTKWGSLFDLSKLTSIRLGIGRSRWGHGRCGGGVRAGAQALRRQEDKALHPSPHTAEALVPSWQESRRMYPFFVECAKKAPFLATSARNACFSRSRWQHPRPMHPFPGAIGRFRIHGARILPPRPPFRVERPEIMHGAKKLPALPGFSAAADRTVWPNGLCALWSMLGSLAACADPLPLELIKCGEAQIERDAGVRPVQKRRDRWAKAINGSGLPHAADNRPTNRASLAAIAQARLCFCVRYAQVVIWYQSLYSHLRHEFVDGLGVGHRVVDRQALGDQRLIVQNRGVQVHLFGIAILERLLHRLEYGMLGV